MNIQQKNNINSIKSISNETEKLLLSAGKSILLVLLIIAIIYFIYYIYKYYSIPCENKIPLYKYLTNFGNSSLCYIPTNNIPEENNSLLNNDTLLNHSNSSFKNEVFQISNQIYTYDQAKCKCESYGARLATKDELTHSYNNGAHWCNYGWIDGNEAYYPVQQCELDRKAKNIKEYNDMLENHYKDSEKYTYKMVEEARKKMYRENSLEFCGHNAGLNGGKFEDKNIKFGVTCFGKKPKGMSVREKDAKCKDTLLSEEMDKNSLNKTKCGGVSKDDIISSFNNDTWNEK